MECIIFVLFFSMKNTIFILFHENCDNFLKNWPFSPKFCPVKAKNSPTGRIHKPGDFWEKQPLTGRSPGLPGGIAGLKMLPLLRPPILFFTIFTHQISFHDFSTN